MMQPFEQRLWLPPGDGENIVGYVPYVGLKTFEFVENALFQFCSENKIEYCELDSLMMNRRLMKDRPTLVEGCLMVNSASILSKLYKGLAIDRLCQYEDAPRYFFVHSSGEGGFFPVCIVGGIQHYVPCVDITDGSPIIVVERGGVGNMKSFFSDLFLVTRSFASTSCLDPQMMLLDCFEFPVSIEFPATDFMCGVEFALGRRTDSGYFSFPSVGFSVLDRVKLSVDWMLISRCEETGAWNFVDSIGKDRSVFNACMRAYCGQRSKGYFVSYSISNVLSVQKDLPGFFNRINLNCGLGLELPDNFPKELELKLRSIFCGSNFNFSKIFGSRYVSPLRSIGADVEIIKIESKSSVPCFVTPQLSGVISIEDLIKGTIFDRNDMYGNSVDLVPPEILLSIYSNYPDRSVCDAWPQMLSDLSYQTPNLPTSLKQILNTHKLNRLSKSECIFLYFSLLGINCYIEKGRFCFGRGKYQILSVSKFPLIVFEEDVIFVRFPAPHSYLNFIDRSKSLIVDRGPCFYGVSDGNISRMFSLGCHVMYKKDACLLST